MGCQQPYRQTRLKEHRTLSRNLYRTSCCAHAGTDTQNQSLGSVKNTQKDAHRWQYKHLSFLPWQIWCLTLRFILTSTSLHCFPVSSDVKSVFFENPSDPVGTFHDLMVIVLIPAHTHRNKLGEKLMEKPIFSFSVRGCVARTASLFLGL